MTTMVNTFWQNNRKRDEKEYTGSMTVPDMGINIAELLSNGKIEEVSEKLKKRMIYGTQIKITDLTQLDYFRNKLTRYENLIRVNQKNDVNTYLNDKTNKEEPVNNVKESNEKQLKLDVKEKLEKAE